MRPSIITLFALMLIPPVVGAQSLGEAARKAREKREAKSAEQTGSGATTDNERSSTPPARTYTQEDLAVLPPVQVEVGSSEPAKPSSSGFSTRPASITSSGDDSPAAANQSAWRGRMRAAENELIAAKAHLEAVENRRKRTLDTKGVIGRELDKARARVKAAEQAIAQIQDDARREDVPPGWLR